MTRITKNSYASPFSIGGRATYALGKRSRFPWHVILGVWILFIADVCLSAASDESQYIELSDNSEPIFNPSLVDYYPDTKGEQTIESLINQPQLFSRLQSTLTLKSPKIHWYQMPIKNTSNEALSWVVGIGVASPMGFRAYWVTDDGTITPIPLWASSRYASRANSNILLRLSAEEHGRLFLEYQSFAHFPLNISIHTPEQYVERRLTFTVFNGMALGALLTFLVFFLVHFLLNRRLHIGFYCLFVLSLFLFAIQVFGYGVRNVWPGKMALNSQMTSFFAACIYLFYFLFTAYLFEHTPKLRRALIVLAYIVAVVSALGFLYDTALLLTAIVTAGMPLAIIAAAYALPKQRTTAIFFIIGSGLHYALTCLLLFKLMGMRIGTNSFTLATLGQLIDIICLSTAIIVQSRSTEKQLHWQVEQRLSDMEALAASEQHATQLRFINKDAILNSATTAHDVLQVLASIRLQIASKKSSDPSAELLEKAVNYATDLLNTRIRTGKRDFGELNRQQNIQEILSNVALRFQSHHKNLRFRVQAKEIFCSEIVINRIVDNLLSNALKYTRGDILLTGRIRKSGYWIQVWDRGNGIADDKLQKIFEPFTQLQTHNIDDWGFGLGLYIVRFLCEDSNYIFRVRTKMGKGTCFTIEFNSH